MQEYNLDEKWDYENEFATIKIGGTWDVFDKKLKGELIYSKNTGQINLELFTKIHSKEDYFQFISNDNEIAYINGTTNNHKDCILKKCEIIETHLNNFDLRIFIKANTLFIDYGKKEKTVKFNEIDFRLTNSLIWANANYFKFLNTRDNKVNLVYEPEKSKTIKINDHTRITFRPTRRTGDFLLNKENIHLVQYVTINILKNEATHYDEFMEDIEKIINLIAFATNKNVTIYNLIGYNENKFITFEDEKDYLPIEIIDSKMRREKTDEDIFNRTSPLFDLNDMKKNKNLSIWFNKYEEYRNIFNLFLLNIKNEIPLEIQFNNLMQALELIHRIKYKHKTKFVNHIQYKFKNNPNIIENILEHKDQKDCAYIILRSRLIDLLSNDFALFQEEYSQNHIILFADILTDSRNYYTHYNESKKEKSVKGYNLEYAIVILEYLIKALMLQELNFKLEDINEMLEKETDFIDRLAMIKNICESFQ